LFDAGALSTVYGDHTTISNALEELRKGFFSGIPARLQKIEKTIEETLAAQSGTDSLERIQSLIIAFHSLAGTSATYGYYDISKHAKAAERHLKSIDPDNDDMQRAMSKLRAYQQAISIDIEEEGSKQLTDQKLKQLTTYLEINQRLENILIYLADEDESFIEELNTLLLSSGFKVQYFTTLYELEERIRYQRPDILIIDSDFSGDEYAGFDFIISLNESLENRIPTIFISEHNDNDHKYRASSVMGCFYLQKPINITELLHSIELVVNRTFTEPHRVLVVDNNTDHGNYVSHVLQQSGIQAQVVNDANKVLNCIDEFSPEVILLDIYMPGYNGIELASMIRLDPKQQFTSILFLSVEEDSNQQLEALGLGGDDFLTKPIDPRILIRTVEIRAQRARAFKKAYFELQHTVNELEQFKIALDQHAIVSIADRDGRITYANPRFCKVSGYKVDELIGRNHNILNSGFHSRQFFSDMWQTISSGNTWQGEIKNRGNNGKEYWVESTITPFLDESGQPYQYVSIRTDITRQKKIAEELSISEERLRRSQSYANIGTWDWDIRTGELHWSELIGPLFGYDRVVDTTYENFINAVHPEDRQFVMDAVNACVEQGQSYDIEHRIIRTDGKIRWLSEKGDAVRDKQGQPLHMLGVVQDITSRKQAEQNLQESQNRLIQAQTQAQLGNWEANLQTGELYWSDVIYTIFGHDPATFTPSVQAFHEAVHPDDRELVLASERRAKETGVHDVIHRIIRPNGEVRYVHELAKQIFNQAGQATHLLGTVQDITELKQTEQRLIAAKEEAESANRAKSEFLSRMSHELRTPMNAILGFAQLMESDEEDPLSENHRSSNEQILKAGWHLLELINEVLDLSKIESGKLDVSIETVDAGQVITECLELVKAQAKQYDVTIEHHANEPLEIQADRIRFKQVYLNLLTNAIKYNRRGGKVTLTSALSPSGDGIKFIVEDTGAGITGDQLTHLFEPFNRLGAEDSAIEGTGIGLVIARRLVEIMGGDIGVESTPGKGSKFYFTMRLGNDLNGPLQTIEQDESDTRSQTMDTAGFTVLYVEDNPANLKLVNQILMRVEGVKLYSETTGINGLNTARRLVPDLILLDINLPDMSGVEIAQVLKSEEQTSQIPLIAISANAMPQDVSTALSHGFADYLTKPIDVGRFTRLINDFKQSGNRKTIE
jgi:PAS domain S-box-containing protein